MVTPRRRLTPEQRRDELLDVGDEQFAARPYDEVDMSEVATGAGVSRALLYRYFPSKHYFFAAVFRRASERLLAASTLDPTLPLAEQVDAGLAAHFDYFRTNARTVLAANRGAMAGDLEVQGIIAGELAVLQQRILAAVGAEGPGYASTSMALNGWLSFVRAACLDWLEDPAISQDELKAMCLRVLSAALDSDVLGPPVIR